MVVKGRVSIFAGGESLGTKLLITAVVGYSRSEDELTEKTGSPTGYLAVRLQRTKASYLCQLHMNDV